LGFPVIDHLTEIPEVLFIHHLNTIWFDVQLCFVETLNTNCLVRWLGILPYQEAWDLQNQIAAGVAQGTESPTLLLLEHPHTYTFGRRANAHNLLWGPEELAKRGVEVHWVDRGGDVTYHGPGQLVGYPILPLAPVRGWQGDRLPQADYVGYVRRLEDVIIQAVSTFGLATGQVKGSTGVWIQPEVYQRCLRCDPALRVSPAKLASIGVKVDVHGVSRHGFALNVDPDPEYWSGIIPCGLEQVAMVSLADFLQPVPGMETIVERVSAAFGDIFGYQMNYV